MISRPRVQTVFSLHFSPLSPCFLLWVSPGIWLFHSSSFYRVSSSQPLAKTWLAVCPRTGRLIGPALVRWLPLIQWALTGQWAWPTHFSKAKDSRKPGRPPTSLSPSLGHYSSPSMWNIITLQLRTWARWPGLKAQPLTSCVTLGLSLPLSRPQFLHL